MIKDKPEVDDVWVNKYGEEAHIIDSDTYIIVFVRKYWITNYKHHYEVNKRDLNRFIKDYRYFYKSKANINDLFEVQND